MCQASRQTMNKAERLEKLLPNGRGVWIPIDHGMSDFPCQGLENTEVLIRDLISAGVDAIVAQKGVVSHYSHLCNGTSTNMVIHFSASTRHGGADASRKVSVGQASEVESRGGMAASAQVNIGSEGEASMLEALGELTTTCHHLGLPVLGMVYARGPNLNIVEGDSTKGVAHAARVAFEIGCDVGKTTWTGDEASFAQVTAAAPIPLLVAGGAKTNTLEMLTMVEKAMKNGAAGVCMGRQVFAHKQPSAVARALVQIVHHGASAKDAMNEVGL
ncbi:MAG: class I fructose-bisphosphate aldolase [Candidatus Poseidoniaceae archaeon]